MKKRILAMFLAVCSLMSLTAFGAFADAEINSLPDYETLADAQPTIKLNDVPEEATDVSYGWLNNIPAIDQIDFTYDGHSYCFRAAACPGGSSSLDISGVSEQLPSITTVEVSGENQVGGSYVLRYDSQSGKGVANWASEMAETQYSLYTEDGCQGDKVEEMPMYEMADWFFAYDETAQLASGTVLDTTDNTLVLRLTSGGTAVLNCEHIQSITVDTNDTVDVYYLGEIDGDAEAVRILPADANGLSGNTFSGSIFRYIDDSIYVMTDDDNVFAFEVNSSTVISGAASYLAENEDVVVTYSGDLYDDPAAVEVNVTHVGVAPTPEPTSAPAPAYQDRYVDGLVTSVAGIYVTVNGILFTVNGADCYVSGTPTVGCYANISYRDYGSYRQVTSAYFAAVPAPTPTPTRKTYTTTGKVSALNYPYVTIVDAYGGNPQNFALNTSNIDGIPSVGCSARIDYYDYGKGYREVTYAKFTAPVPDPYDVRHAAGNASNYTGSRVDIGGQRFIINGGTTIVGSFVNNCYAEVTYNAWHDGTSEATYIVFYPPAPTPTPYIPTPTPYIPTPPPIVGPVGAGWTCTVCGMRNGVYDQFCSKCGSPRFDGSSEGSSDSETQQHSHGFVGGFGNPFAGN